MQKITSFTIDHTRLKPGIYVSRIDECNNLKVTTFDLRLKTPNVDAVMDTAPIHAFEHLGATFLRNSKIKEDIVYFGPMGCRTGFYLLVFGKVTPEEIYSLIVEMCEFIINFNGEIFGATPIECGNYSDQNLELAKAYIKEYKNRLIENKNFKYPN